MDGYSVITLEDGAKFDIPGLETPDYGVDNEGNSHIFTKEERETLASHMIKKWVEYSQKVLDNA